MMGVEKTAKLVSIGAVVFAFSVLGYSSAFSAYMNENPKCTAAYEVCGVSVCETAEPLTGGVFNYLASGATNGTVISLNTRFSFVKDYTLSHEMCHVRQYREGRNYDEVECWLAGLQPYRC